MTNRPMQRLSCVFRKTVHQFAVAVAIIAYGITISCATAGDGRNQLPRKQHKDSDAPFLVPAEAVSKMAIPDGFEVSVFAAEPDIAEPIAFCFDDRGRIWVVENFNYQTRKKHTDDPVSRIQILEDTDGDGVFDKKKTFTDKLTFTSGIACGFGGVFVGSPPNFSFIPDKSFSTFHVILINGVLSKLILISLPNPEAALSATAFKKFPFSLDPIV